MDDAPVQARSATLEKIKGDLDRLRPELAEPQRASVKDHYLHLRQLSETLQTLGLDEHVIGEHVIAIFDTYRTELMRSIAPAP
jgi:hypothetical protein